jgi:hypothetical protein
MAEKAEPAVVETPAATKINQVALWAMITGIAGLTVGWSVPLPWSLAAVILGHIGLSQLKRGVGYGRGYAIAGLATGYTGIALALLVFASVVFAFVTLGVDGVQNMLNDMDSGSPWDMAPGMMNP